LRISALALAASLATLAAAPAAGVGQEPAAPPAASPAPTPAPAPRPSRAWAVSLSGWAGAAQYDILGLPHGLSSVDETTLDRARPVAGASLLLRWKLFALGLLAERTLDAGHGTFVVAPLAGLTVDLGRALRLDLLAELGGHRVAQPLGDASATWLSYVGVRPALSFRVPAGPARVLLSASPFARWDLVRQGVTAESNPAISYQLGGTTFGIVGGVGVEL
jgi:hypothetical protein